MCAHILLVIDWLVQWSSTLVENGHERWLQGVPGAWVPTVVWARLASKASHGIEQRRQQAVIWLLLEMGYSYCSSYCSSCYMQYVTTGACRNVQTCNRYSTQMFNVYIRTWSRNMCVSKHGILGTRIGNIRVGMLGDWNMCVCVLDLPRQDGGLAVYTGTP